MLKSTSSEFRRQVALEFRAQILETQKLLREAGFTGRLRLDSHQHTHMIPGVFKVVCGIARELDYHYFFGLLITGKMDYDRVMTLLPLMPEKRPVELVLHTGRMLETEITPEYNKKDFIKEHISNWRLLENETAMRLKL